MLSKLLDFVFDGWGKVALAAGLFAAIFTWWQLDRASQRQIGALTERTHTEAQNNDAIDKADAAGAASRDPRVRGVRDPYAGPNVGAGHE